MKRHYKVGEWVCMFGRVTERHGDNRVVLQVGPAEITMLEAELWNPDDDLKTKKKTKAKPKSTR